jgi:hypothetical protein
MILYVYIYVESDATSNWHNFGISAFHQSVGIFLTAT